MTISLEVHSAQRVGTDVRIRMLGLAIGQGSSPFISFKPHAPRGVVVPRVEVVQPRLRVVVLGGVGEELQVGRAGEHLAVFVVQVRRRQVARFVGEGDDAV